MKQKKYRNPLARWAAGLLTAALLVGLWPAGALATEAEAASLAEGTPPVAATETATEENTETPETSGEATDAGTDNTTDSDSLPPAEPADDTAAPPDATDAPDAQAEPEARTQADDPAAEPYLVGGPLADPVPADGQAQAGVQADDSDETPFPEGAFQELPALLGAPYDKSYDYYAATSDRLYYYTDANGQFCVVSVWPDEAYFLVHTFDSSFNLVNTQRVDYAGFTEWGGFYQAPDGHFYVAVGRANDTEDNALTVVEIRRYNAAWALTGTTELKDINTTLPFRAGTCRMAMAGNTLVVRMAHQMYTDLEDGLRHQANATFLIDSTTMARTGGFWGVRKVHYCGYVSHSFNQFVQVQGDDVLFVDHGDAHPRSIVLSRAANIAGGFGDTSYVELINLWGATGQNSTGTTLTGFELGQNGNLVLGGSVPHDQAVNGVTGYDESTLVQNVYLMVTDKATDAATFHWLTDYDPTRTDLEVGEPRLVKLDDDRFVVLFTVTVNDVPQLEYRLVNSSGAVLASQSFPGAQFASGSQPLVQNGHILWVGGEANARFGGDYPRYLYNLKVTDPAAPALQCRLRAIAPQEAAMLVKLGTSRQLEVTFTPLNAHDKRLAWTTGDPAVATVDENGKVTAIGYGQTTIRATSLEGGFIADCEVTVPIPVTGIQFATASENFLLGEQRTLQATIQPANADVRTLSWQSGDPAVATVDANGRVNAVAVGSTVITATTEDGGFSATCLVTVTIPNVTRVALAQSVMTLTVYSTVTIPATAVTSDGTPATLAWTSSNPKVATVDNDGKVTTMGAGKASIKATAQNGKSATLKLTVLGSGTYYTDRAVTSVKATVPKTMTAGSRKAITKASYSPTSVGNLPVLGVQISYKSSKKSVVSVDAAGVLTAKKKGTATITVKAGNATQKYTVQVTAPKAKKLTLNETSATLKRKGKMQLKVSFTPANADKTVTWKSSNPKVAKVSSKGKVTALKRGQTKITVTAAHGKKKATCTITVE